MIRSRTGTATLAALAIAVHSAVASAQRVEATTRLAVVGVTLIDGTGTPPRPGTTMLVTNGRITAIGPTGRVAIPAGTTRIDGAGRYVIPGLWDMHVHLTARASDRFSNGRPNYMAAADYFFPYFLASGITGIRDMSGQLADLKEMRRRVTAGQLDGPRMLVTGHKIGDREPVVPHGPKGYPNEAAVRKAVQLLRDNGADFVKLEELRPDLYPALFTAARQAQLPVVGHVPPNLGLTRASDLGIRSVEHLMDVMLSASRDSAALRDEALDGPSLWDRVLIRMHRRQQWEVFRRQIEHATHSQDDATTAALLRKLASNNTWMVPTLVANRDIMRMRPDTGIARWSTALLPAEFRTQPKSWWNNDQALAREQFGRQMQLVAQMQRAGVKLLAGTDAVAEVGERAGARVMTARLFTVYGLGEHAGRLLPSIIEARQDGRSLPLTEGLQRRDFAYVEDVADGLLRLADAPTHAGEVVNLATGVLTTVREFAQIAAEVLGVASSQLQFGTVPVRAEEMAHEPVSIARLLALTGWRPESSLPIGLARVRERLAERATR